MNVVEEDTSFSGGLAGFCQMGLQLTAAADVKPAAIWQVHIRCQNQSALVEAQDGHVLVLVRHEAIAGRRKQAAGVHPVAVGSDVRRPGHSRSSSLTRSACSNRQQSLTLNGGSTILIGCSARCKCFTLLVTATLQQDTPACQARARQKRCWSQAPDTSWPCRSSR
jgi:hypothetical protein